MNHVAPDSHDIALVTNVSCRATPGNAALWSASAGVVTWLRRIAGLVSLLVRAALLLFALRCVLWRWEAVRDATSAAYVAAAVGAAVLLLGVRPLIRWALRRRSARSGRSLRMPWRLALGFVASVLLWFLTLGTTGALVAAGVGPIEDEIAASAPVVPPTWTPEMDHGRRAYDGRMTADGRFLFVTQARSEDPGLMRFDLERNEWQTLPHGRQMSVFPTLFEDLNLGVVVDSTSGVFDQSPETIVQWFRLDPFELLEVQRLPFGRVSSAMRVDADTLAFLSTWGHLIFAPVRPQVEDREFSGLALYLPAGTPPRPLDGTAALHELFGSPRLEYLNLESAVREPDGRHAWLSAEMGRTVARFDLETRTLDRSIPVGFFTWQTAFDAQRRRVYVARTLQRRVDGFDADTGELVASYQLRGVPRPVLLDPDGKHLYVGLHWNRLIETIDLETGQPVGYVKTGLRLRRLIWRSSPAGDEVLALCEEGLYRVPASLLKAPRPGAADVARRHVAPDSRRGGA